MGNKKNRRILNRIAPAAPGMLVRKPALSEAFQTPVRTINAWMRARRIPFRKVGRIVLFDLAEVREALDRYKIRAVGESKRA